MVQLGDIKNKLWKGMTNVLRKQIKMPVYVFGMAPSRKLNKHTQNLKIKIKIEKKKAKKG